MNVQRAVEILSQPETQSRPGPVRSLRNAPNSLKNLAPEC